jgi:molybdenum cofactor cytidylyltransferase
MSASPPIASRFAFGVVVLAAGLSSRMGQPKLVLPWGPTSVLGHLLAQWGRLGAQQIGVVCAAGDHVLAAELERLGFPAAGRIYNPTPEHGMFSSIQAASQWSGWSRELTHWAVVLGDQPHLRQETLSGIIQFSATHPEQVCQPARRGHGRHPVFLPQAVFSCIGLSGAANLKEFLRAMPGMGALWESEDEGLDLDLDHPEDYRALLKLAPGAAHSPADSTTKNAENAKSQRD